MAYHFQESARLYYRLALVLVCSQICLLSSGGAGAACLPDSWTAPTETGGAGVQALLKDIPLNTKWADLTATTKAQLESHANNRLAAFRARWGGDALSKKETILLECPTPAMSEAIDEYYRKSYDTVLPATFSLKDVTNVPLARALVRNYLGSIAAFRASITYPSEKLPNRDWDGRSLFDSLRLPDKRTYEDIRQFSAGVTADLKKIDDASLNELEKALKQRTLFDSRALAAGGFSADSFGGADMETACEIVALNNDVLQGYNIDKGRPKIFLNDDEVLREINAVYLNNTPLKWLDVGTANSAVKLTLCNGTDDGDVERYVGNPAASEVAKGIILLKSWWIERMSSSAEALNKCTVYSDADRAQIWEAFSADQRSNNDGSSSMATYKVQLESYSAAKVTKYRDAAKFALQQVFPDDTVLTASQRQQVLAMISTETAFGRLIEIIAKSLDAAQGTTDGAAAGAWTAAFKTKLEKVGANYPKDEITIKKMFEEVKAWVGARYAGYPIDVASQFSKFQFTVNESGGAETATATGDIKFGVGTQRSKMEYYSILLHELRHAVGYALRATSPDKSKVASDMGTAVEGSGVAVEELLLTAFLKETLNDDLLYALYNLDYGIRDARFAGTTDATLQKYFRNGCSGTEERNTIDFVKKIAASYGLTSDKADMLAQRAHAGAQYFQYISAGVQIVDDIKYLQQQIDPSGQHQIDPFVLFACGLNTPGRDQKYVADLRACMKL